MENNQSGNAGLNPEPQSSYVPGGVISPSTVQPTTPAINPNSLNQEPVIPAPIHDVQPVTLTEPVLPSAGANPAFSTGSGTTKPSSRSSKKKLILILVPLLVVLLGGGAAAYFGYYAPNQPDNLWKTALTRTGKGYDKLTDYTLKQAGAKNKGINIDGSFKTSGSFAADGTLKGSSDGGNGQFSSSLSASGLKINLDTRLIKSATSAPDIYFKVDGLQGLAQFLFGHGYGDNIELYKKIEGLNNNWYFIDHTLIDQYAQGADTKLQISQDDISSVLKAVGTASKQNVFTSDESRMAFGIKQKIGREKQDNHSVYHFKVGINKKNLKNYADALCNNLKNSNLKKFFNNDPKAVSSALDCDTNGDILKDINESDTADVWVDTHTKLVHRVRFTDKSNSANYFDIGQDYQGGDQIPFLMDDHYKSSGTNATAHLGITLNTKTNNLNISANLKESTSDNSTSNQGSLELNISPNNKEIRVDKPSGAKNILQLVNDLGFDDLFGGGGESAADSQRMTALHALKNHLEANAVTNNYYPTLAQLNSPSWRSANMAGAPADIFKDPAGTSQNLANTPAAHVYAYQALPTGCNNTKITCTDYKLTATLDDGSPYDLKSAGGVDTTPVIQD